MKKLPRIIQYVIILLLLAGANGEFFTMLGGAIVGIGSYLTHCTFMECCNNDYIYFDLIALEAKIKYQLYGQPLAVEVIHALKGHLNSIDRNSGQKALTLSFHGVPGVGKNYVANMIRDSLYKKGEKSKYVKLYVGRHHFPDPNLVNKYRKDLISDINRLLKSCPRSLIIFDEINDIPEGVIDAIKVMIDFHQTVDGVDYSKAIFILLSNTAGKEITDHFMQLRKPRENIVLSDFENIIRHESFQKGGLKESNILYSNLIDHYIPFLPLEQCHVEQCLKAEFQIHGVYHPTQEMIEQAMSTITYGPKHNPIFSNAGCKRIRKTVAYVAAKYNNTL